MKKLRSLDLFSGYGGITLALNEYVRPIAYVEIEEYAQKIIANRMADGSIPRAAILGDVKNVKGSFGICDIIYGGFPCQDISYAGTGKGLAGKRSGLFYEVIRLTKEIRPSFVFLENVPAIKSRGLEQVIKTFTEIGYDCRWTCLSAASVGANHKRERWFLLAHANGVRKLSKQDAKRISFDRSGNSSENVSDSAGSRLSGTARFGLKKKQPGIKHNFSRYWWSTEPEVGRVANGVAFRVDRIKALGNGVVPLQVRTAFEVLMGIR